MVRGTVKFGVAILHPPRGHVGLHPDDRLNPCLGGRVVEIDHPEHRAVVGDRHSRHVQFLDAFHQLLDIREAIKQRIFGVDVQVSEGHGDLIAL